MITHYFKMALRSLMKYKVQNLICIIGIAVGFACFVFSSIWIKYELSYDSFHRDADRIYVLYEKSGHEFTGYSNSMSYPIARDIKNLFTEFEETSTCMNWPGEIGETKEGKVNVMELIADSSFIKMFDIRLISGSLSFLDNESEIALTEEAALRIFGTKDILGKELVYRGEETKKVSAIVSGFGKHTNFRYDIITGIEKSCENDYNTLGFHVCCRVKANADLESLAEKLKHTEMKLGENMVSKEYLIQKLTSCHYTIFQDNDTISLMYVKLFSAVGIVVIFISLVNFFSILVTRINIRKREIALRISCGSGIKSMISLFATELFIIILVSGFSGMVLIEILETKFVELSGVETEFYLPSLSYFVILLVLSLAISLFIIRYYTHKSVSEVLNRRKTISRDRVTFQGSSIMIQFIISIFVLFSLSVIFKQLHYLSSTEDLGFEREGRATLIVFSNKDEAFHFVKSIPYVYDAKIMYSLLPQSSSGSIRVDSWDEKPEAVDPVIVHIIDEGQEFIDFYGLKLLKGSGFSGHGDIKSAIINETAVRKFGWNEPIGKMFRGYTVTGVVKDFHISPPTLPVQPFMITMDSDFRLSKEIVIRYDKSHEDDLRKEIEEFLIKSKYSDYSKFRTAEEEYNKYLTSERSLMKLLVFVAVVCVVISLFGVYSHVSLACERRRKEIAVRKINGATVGSIMKMFIWKYFSMLLLSAVIAFPVATFFMKLWLQQYLEQTSVGILLYMSVFVLLSVLIMLCIWHSIWKASNENPSEVIKSE